MIRTRSISAVALIALSACGADAPRDGPETPVAAAQVSQLQSDLQSAVDAALKNSPAPGRGVAIVTREEGLVALAVAGLRVNGRDSAVQPDDLWHIGSCTKAVTAALFATRVEAGAAEWSAPLADIAPELFSEAAEAWKDVPVEAFLAHRSAIEERQPDWFAQMRLEGLKGEPVGLLREEAVRRALSSPPGESIGDFAYSNLGYVVVGAALQEGHGAWEDQAQEFLLELGLEAGEFGFGPPQGDNPQGHVGPRGFPVGTGFAADNPDALGPAGTMHMSLEGWAKFVRVFLTDGGGVLSRESVDKLLTPWPEGGEYAMGWIVIEPGRRFQHAGSNTYWFAVVELDLERGRAVLVTANAFTPETRKAALDLVAAAMKLD